MTGIRSRLIGGWRMIDMKTIKNGELHDLPIGPTEQCGGLLIYTESGLMSAALSLLSRPAFTDPSLGGGGIHEKAYAYDTFVSYCGTFEIDEDTATVHHRVQYASVPHFVGQDLRRACIFDGDILTLDTPPMKFNGEELASYVKWIRI